MSDLINILRQAIWKALGLIGQFLSVLALGLLAALLYAFPWLLRAASILSWLAGATLALQSVQTLYRPISPTGPVLVLQFATIFTMVAWVGTMLRAAPHFFWGGLALCGVISIWITRQIIPWLIAEWNYANLFFRILPPSLFSMLLIYLTMRMRLLRTQQLFLSEKPSQDYQRVSKDNEETMSEATQTNTLINSLLGRDIETDHGGLSLGDVIVLILDLVLLIYTGWRSYDFLTTSVPAGYELLALVGLWGLDIGAVAWSLVWIFGSSTKYQDWTSMFFFIFDLVGVILTSLTDSLMYGKTDSALSGMLTGIAIVVVPLIVVANAVAGFIYHMTSPQTKQRRAKRRADNEHFEKMQEIGKLERDLQYAESYILARQEVLDKSVALAQIKMLQDQTEREMRLALRDQTGIHGLSPQMNGDDGKDRLVSLRNRIESLRKQAEILTSPDNGQDESESLPVPEPLGFSNNSGNGHHPQEPLNFP